MLKLAIKNALANRSRFALTALAVVLSVGFLTSTLILSDSMTGTAADDIATANTGIDAVVQGDTIVEGGGGPGEIAEMTRQSLPADTAAATAGVDGVGDVAPVVTGFAKLVDNGRAVGDGVAADIGIGWVLNTELNPFTIAEGTAPTSTGEIAVDRSVANDAGVAVGDQLQVLTSTGVHDVTVTGIASYGNADAAPARRTTFFAADTAAVTMGTSSISQILVDFDATANPAAVLASLQTGLPEVAVVSGADFTAVEQNAVTSPLAFLSVFLLAFAAIATVVGVTIIYNTFAIAISQRRRELALLRAVGAERRQVMRSVMAEAAIIAVLATAAGIGFGILGVGAMKAVMTGLGLTFLTGPTVITATTLAVATGAGLVATLASAWVPARSAASTAPIEALRESAAEASGVPALRSGIGISCLVIGGGGLVAAVVLSNTLLLAAAGLLIPGLILAGPTIINAAVTVTRPILKRVAGVEGSIATTNLERNPRRSSSTALSLTLGVGLIAFFTILASTFTASLTADLENNLTANHVVTSVSTEVATIDPDLAERLGAIDGINAIAPVAQADGLVDGNEATVAGIAPSAMTEVFDLGVTDGDLAELGAGGIAVVNDGTTTAPVLGDVVAVQLGDAVAEFPVVAIVSNSLGGFDAPTHFVGADTLTTTQSGLLDTVVYLSVSDLGTVDLEAAVAATPGSLLETRQSYLDGASTEVDSFRNFIYSLLGLTVLIAVVGIANTTALSISERLKEVGLLRAIGTTRTGIRRIIRYEAILLAIVGTLTGLAVAVAGGWALITVAGGAELATVAIPWLSLGIIGLGAIAAGTAAAAYPAWRSSRTPTLEAIANA